MPDHKPAPAPTGSAAPDAATAAEWENLAGDDLRAAIETIIRQDNARGKAWVNRQIVDRQIAVWRLRIEFGAESELYLTDDPLSYDPFRLLKSGSAAPWATPAVTDPFAAAFETATAIHTHLIAVEQAKRAWWAAHIGDGAGEAESHAAAVQAWEALNQESHAAWEALKPLTWKIDADQGRLLQHFLDGYAAYWQQMLARRGREAWAAEQALRPFLEQGVTRSSGPAGEVRRQYHDLIEAEYQAAGAAGNRSAIRWWRLYLPEWAAEWDVRYGTAGWGDYDVDAIRSVVASNEGAYDSAVVLPDGAGLSFGIFQWTARHQLREQIIAPNLDKGWFRAALGPALHDELVARLNAEDFVQWSAGDAVRAGFVRLGQTPELKAFENQVANEAVRASIGSVAHEGLFTTERGMAWYMDARNQTGHVYLDALRQAISQVEAVRGCGLCEQEKVLLGAKVQAKFGAATEWESDVFGREAAFALDAVPGNGRSNYSEFSLGSGPQQYLGRDTLTLELDPSLFFGVGGGLTDQLHPALAVTFAWSDDAQTYLKSAAGNVDPASAQDPTKGMTFDPPVTTGSRSWRTWPAADQ